MRTRITELLGIEHPVLLSGVSFASDPALTAAVSNAGGLGILGGAPYSAEGLKQAIREIKSTTDKPFGVNITFTNPGVGELIRVLLEEKVPVINYSLGRAAELVKRTHEYGGKVLGTIALLKHAIRAEQDGADALIVTGHEAAAHGSEVASLVLIPTVATRTKVPLVAAGGFSDGRGLAAALVLGADAIAMGTAFMLAKECRVPHPIKEQLLAASEMDTVVTDHWDGMPSRMLNNAALAELTKKKAPGLSLISGMLQVRRLLGVSLPEMMRGARRTAKAEGVSVTKLSTRSLAVLRMQKALVEGDEKDGTVPVGQVIGRLKDEPTCRELVERTVREAETILRNSGKYLLGKDLETRRT